MGQWSGEVGGSVVHVHPLLLSQVSTGSLQGCDVSVSGAGRSCLSPGGDLEQICCLSCVEGKLNNPQQLGAV